MQQNYEKIRSRTCQQYAIPESLIRLIFEYADQRHCPWFLLHFDSILDPEIIYWYYFIHYKPFGLGLGLNRIFMVYIAMDLDLVEFVQWWFHIPETQQKLHDCAKDVAPWVRLFESSSIKTLSWILPEIDMPIETMFEHAGTAHLLKSKIETFDCLKSHYGTKMNKIVHMKMRYESFNFLGMTLRNGRTDVLEWIHKELIQPNKKQSDKQQYSFHIDSICDSKSRFALLYNFILYTAHTRATIEWMRKNINFAGFGMEI